MNLSIKNAPEAVVGRLRERAERHHRSSRGELLPILEVTIGPDQGGGLAGRPQPEPAHLVEYLGGRRQAILLHRRQQRGSKSVPKWMLLM